jgi:dihydropteroate synthase
MLFVARQFEFRFPRPALVMGIVNVTPDSFSDGGKYLDADAAVAHALKLVEEGAEILDVGGESSRPGAQPVSESEELRRVIPVIEELAPRVKVPISIDTTKTAVARAALAAGASIVNDVGAAARTDFSIWRLVAEYQAGYIVTHSQGSPSMMQDKPVYLDVVREVGEFFAEQLVGLLNEGGVATEQVALDPGVGFGKTLEHNLRLLAGLQSFARKKRPLVLGVSRKSFIQKLLGSEVDNRLPASLACTVLALADGVNIIRTHDVAETVQSVRMAEAVLSHKIK